MNTEEKSHLLDVIFHLCYVYKPNSVFPIKLIVNDKYLSGIVVAYNLKRHSELHLALLGQNF